MFAVNIGDSWYGMTLDELLQLPFTFLLMPRKPDNEKGRGCLPGSDVVLYLLSKIVEQHTKTAVIWRIRFSNRSVRISLNVIYSYINFALFSGISKRWGLYNYDTSVYSGQVALYPGFQQSSRLHRLGKSTIFGSVGVMKASSLSLLMVYSK